MAATPTLEEIRQGRGGARDRVLLRAVRRPLRAAEREARPGREPRRPRRRRRRASPASPPARSASSRATPTSPRSPTSRASRRCPGSRTSRASPATSRRGRGVAVLPAHDPAPPARARPRARLRVQDRASSSSTSSSARREDGSIELADPLDTLEKPCYDLRGLTRQLRLPRPRSRATCNELGWGNYANDHEDANGQFEQNFTYADALVELRPRDLLPLHGAHARRAAAGCSRRSCRSRSRT